MKIVFLAKWHPDADSAAVEGVDAVAATSLAAGPFSSFQHGPGLHLAKGSTRIADWGFLAEIDPADVEEWRASEAHQALGQAIRPLCAEGMTIEF